MQIQVNDIFLNYELNGPPDSPLITFSHCLSGNLNIWQPQISGFSNDFRCLTFDIRGHGQSSAPSEEYSMDMLASDVVSLWDSLNIDRSHFVGISMGGMIGQVLATKYPERITSLVLCDTTCRVPSELLPIWQERIHTAQTRGMKEMVEATLERWLSPEFRQAHPDIENWISSMIINTPVSGYVGCCRAISSFDLSQSVSSIQSPTLIVVGENDPGTPVSEAQTLHSLIQGSELAVLPKAYHLSNIEAAEDFNDKVERFLRKHVY